MVQKKATNIEEAKNLAKEISAQYGYAAIVFSQQAYYIENEPPLIRIHEILIGEFKNGKLIGKLIKI